MTGETGKEVRELKYASGRLVEQIEEKSNKYLDEQLKMLETLVGIDSGTGNIDGNKRIVTFISERLKSIGASIEIKKDMYGGHIIARIHKGNPNGKLLICAHTDTIFKEGDVKERPFRIEGDYAYGLGISDDKGGIVTAYYALKIMSELNQLPDKEIVVIFNCDEEIGSPTSRSIFREEGENAQCAFVFEPARENNGIITLRGAIGYFTIEVWGKEAHAGTHFLEGRNAITELSDKILRIHQMSSVKEDIVLNIGSIEGGKNGKTPSIIPGYAKASFSIRVKNKEKMERVQKEIKKLESQILIEGCKVKISGEFVYLPMTRETNLPLYEIAKEAGMRIGIKLEELHALSGSDANHIAATGIPTIDALGAYEYDMHTKEEHIYIPSLTERTKLFSNILSML